MSIIYVALKTATTHKPRTETVKMSISRYVIMMCDYE